MNSIRQFSTTILGTLASVSTLFLLLNSCQTSSISISSQDDKHGIHFLETMSATNTTNSEHLVFTALQDGKRGWMNVLGAWVIPPVYDSIQSNFDWKCGMLSIRKDGKYGVVNYKNEVIVPFEYDLHPFISPEGIIELQRRKEDGYLESAYVSCTGEKLTDFGRFSEFRNGITTKTSNQTSIGSYQRFDSDYFSELCTANFALVNTQFDTILYIENSPFLLELGTLNNNRRSFVLYPYLTRHADRGISNGLYGYLDAKGAIVVEPKFPALYALIQKRNGYDWSPNYPFTSNRSLVEKPNDEYAFIDTNGNEVIVLDFIEGSISRVSQFNNYGLAGIVSFSEEPFLNKIYLIDTSGRIVFESNQREAWLGLGAVMQAPGNTLIPVVDKKNREYRMYTPSFELIHTFPLNDSSYRYGYSHYDIGSIRGDQKFCLEQERSAKAKSRNRTLQKRILSSDGSVLTSWVDSKRILSHKYGVYSYLDTITNITTLYDFEHNEVYSCKSCFFSEHKDRLGSFGIFYVYHKTEDTYSYVNYEGTVLNELFDSMHEDIIQLELQINACGREEEIGLSFSREQLVQLFENSEMVERIRYTGR